ncbi:sensor histidine kinase [Actinokineospora xionganensis]|uniref:Sensor histidine kinase n=1 Tax=Actinokineospora xionganensis TaxID=2684470 RepID=A0ABR7L3T0_9PSEU|nr:sensor histidine kinase [Actinokineospora xionganensis]MBC6447237.1 sensor histidine kinase [Actinokineospora xionganensis]
MTQAWDRSRWIWDVYFAIGFAAVVVLVVTETQPAARQAGALAALTALVAWYALYGRRVILTDDIPRGTVFVAGLAALFFTAVGFTPESTYALFMICPMVFMTFRLRISAPLVALFNVLPPIFSAVFAGISFDPHDFGLAFFGLAFSLLIGTYIHRIVRQSEDRAELITELESSRAEVARLSHDAGVNAERARLAGEIHDTLAQGFTSIITLVQAAESEVDSEKGRRLLDLAARTARENLAEARVLVSALAPSALSGGSLADALGRQVERLRAETGVDARFHAEGTAPLPTGVEVLLLRAAQEALANVRKHAAASTVDVSLTQTDQGVTLRVTDDGVGFHPDDQSGGFGLRGMRARAEQVAATVSVRSAPGAGTTVTVEVLG